jgi:hypothetical protein
LQRPRGFISTTASLRSSTLLEHRWKGFCDKSFAFFRRSAWAGASPFAGRTVGRICLR